jgi:murein DD-endopeptidase MepM/ murein hydrolase activator NlpD
MKCVSAITRMQEPTNSRFLSFSARTRLRVTIVGLVWLTACGDPYVLSPFRSQRGVDGRLRALPHSGVDFVGAVGDPVLAAADGWIVDVSIGGPCGNSVMIGHIQMPKGFYPYKYYTVYCHLSHVSVSLSDRVRRGQTIGAVGDTGPSSGVPHLHLALCQRPCPHGSPDGEFDGVLDPMLFDAGCFEEGRRYSSDHLILTHPIDCSKY